jgi:hypothetical protein
MRLRMTDPAFGSEALSIVATALGASRKAADAIAVPTVLLPHQWFGGLKGTKLVDAGKDWFQEHGFFAERSHQGVGGYANVFRQLESWRRPWDVETIRQAHRAETLERRTFIAEKSPESALPESLEAIGEQLFEKSLALIQVMTEEQFDGCYEAIFYPGEDEDGYLDEAPQVAGAPDLFVWHSKPVLPAWFFCELKAPGDYLSAEQHEWIRKCWSRIDGRFLLAMLSPDS